MNFQPAVLSERRVTIFLVRRSTWGESVPKRGVCVCWGRMTSLKPLDFGHCVDNPKTDDNCEIRWGKGDFYVCYKQPRKKKAAVLELRISYMLLYTK